ncbi:MAG: mandelate racemase [bacterium]|nr:mandelate racemase [bacterium]
MNLTRRELIAQTVAAAGLSALAPNETIAAERDAWRRELARHKIARFDSFHLQDRFPRRVGANANGSVQNYGGGFRVRRATTDSGKSGWSMSYQDDAVFEPYIGATVSDLFDVETGVREEARPLDRILYDLAGSILNMPAYVILGARGPKNIPIYSGSIYFDDLLPDNAERGISAVVDACRQDYQAGYRAFKLKMGRGKQMMTPREDGLKRDIEVVRAVRRALPDARILVDANDAYTLDETIHFLTETRECNLYWIEEPFEEDEDQLKRLKGAIAHLGLSTLIADGEARRESRNRQGLPPGGYGDYTEAFVENLMSLAEKKLVDVLLLDLDIIGYSRWRTIMPEFERAGVPVSPHTWAWTPRSYYAAQLAGGLGNVLIVEGIPGQAEGIDYSAYSKRNGDLILPDQPGFGLALELE